MALPTGRELRAARVLAGLTAEKLADLAGVNAATISRLENTGPKKVTGLAQTIEAIQKALARAGVRINEDGSISPINKKPHR